MCGSGRKGASAPTSARRIRVSEREAGPHHARRVIDLDALQILNAETKSHPGDEAGG